MDIEIGVILIFNFEDCPFCGSKNIGISEWWYNIGKPKFYVNCRSCGNRTMAYSTEEEAVENWNKRAPFDFARQSYSKPQCKTCNTSIEWVVSTYEYYCDSHNGTSSTVTCGARWRDVGQYKSEQDALRALNILRFSGYPRVRITTRMTSEEVYE